MTTLVAHPVHMPNLAQPLGLLRMYGWVMLCYVGPGKDNVLLNPASGMPCWVHVFWNRARLALTTGSTAYGLKSTVIITVMHIVAI